MRKLLPLFSTAAAIVALSGCTSHKVELSTHEDKPIHIIVDVNIKMDEEVKRAFADEDKKDAQITEQQAEKALEEYLNSMKK